MNKSPDRPLFRRWPQLADTLPFIELGTLPTPVDTGQTFAELPSLSIAIKRDDISATDYGGNKIRKLEFLLSDARAQQRDHIITYGGLGSNHARATALNCKKLGLHCTVILTPEPMTPAVQETLDHHTALGTRVEVAERYTDVGEICERVQQEYGRDHCYEIPFGGSSRVGTLGFVNAALELADQINAGECAEPDVIYVACGTAGTVAGLAVGLEIAGLGARIEALQVTPDSMQPFRLASNLIAEVTDDLVAAGLDMPATGGAIARLNIRNDQLGDGYAEPTEAGREAAAIWTNGTGLPTSLTYTAKAFAGLIADARAGQLTDAQTLFWNTYNSQAM
ncbi:MAG: pyridoxal-phosphate dependent enzyme [Gammaproteobacteria bacterium]|nr:pyridoxal-phosphate dependent enzyme [Gammaproteobacteria bacterium]NND55089.1 pyridoxal-phosphate dependent enzyme [Gammaproteobacteria bacterium]